MIQNAIPYIKGDIGNLGKHFMVLKQATREWNENISNTLKEQSFERLILEPYMFIKFDENKNIICIIGIYVDDILITGIEEEIERTVNFIFLKKKKKNTITDFGETNFIMGIKIEKLKRKIQLKSEKIFKGYAQKILYLIKLIKLKHQYQ